MNTKQEDKIIEQAREILERRQDERARMFAVEHEVKISVQRLAMYASYYQGARDMEQKLMKRLMTWVYLEAEWRLFMSSKRNCQLFLDGTEIRYRNHERDKKGKLIRCEAYFTERLTLIREVK